MNKEKIKLAFITPVSELEQTKRGDILYVLSHMLGNDTYSDFVKKSTMYKIFDNSVHEGLEINTDRYFELAKAYKVNEIILQDVMEDKDLTLQKKEEQLNKYYSLLSNNNIKVMGAIQGKSIDELKDIYRNFTLDDRIDTIGISFTLTPKKFDENRYLNCYYNRRYILSELQDMHKNENLMPKPIHLLGASSWHDALLKKKYNFVRSHDTKLLSRLAYSNESIYMRLVGKPKEKITLLEQFTEEQSDNLTKNIDCILKLL